ncbi:TolC family protein [Thiospirochaeta perfilievii]|uniref:TolC family protein n=1 Tax=Thiospirochaeta perfilievii TaxID=252967 RepID=A0A5C1Q8M0_9SPIO|nr:TolC family protein [Thiospirochaeta perfilievii]QEN03390.1 TolC family protein [Thiospirochaeta perfilievii]
MKVKVLVVLILTTASLFAQTSLTTIDEIVNFSLENSSDSIRSKITLENSEDNVESYIKLDETKVSFNSSFKEDGTNSFISSLNIPVIDQLSVNGSFDNNLNGEIGVSINPLSHNKNVTLSEVEYDLALLNYKNSIDSTSKNTIDKALSWMVGKKSLDLLEKEAYRYESLYSDNKDRYENGSITLDELQDSLINWSNARKKLLDQKQSFYTLESSLYSQLGATKEDVVIEILEIEELQVLIEQLKTMVENGSGDYFKNSNYLQSVINEEKAMLNYNAIWVYDPDVSFSAKLGITENGVVEDSFTASVGFTLGLDNINKSEKDSAKEEYLLSVKDKELKLNAAKLDFEMSKDLVESSSLESEITRYEYEQTKILLSEAEILYDAGEYSELELLAAELALQQAHNNLFTILKNEYLNLIDYLKYF